MTDMAVVPFVVDCSFCTKYRHLEKRKAVRATTKLGSRAEAGRHVSTRSEKTQPPTSSPQPSSPSFSHTTSKAKSPRRVGEQMREGESAVK